MVGRPKGTTKDPNRRRVLNPSGRLIDFEGNQYNKLINSGYKLNRKGTKLIENQNFTHVERRGRPKKYLDVTTTHETVKNPKTGRMIKTNTLYFRKIVKEYGYNESKNKILMHISDPKNPDRKIVKNDETFNRYIDRGYIYDKKKNSLIIPSKITKKALDGEVKSYEFSIVNKNDPLVQMNDLEPRAKLLLKRYLNKFKGVKFHIGLTIVFIKITTDGEIKTEPMLLSAKSTTITHKSEFNGALKKQREGVLRQIDRFTNRGSGWTIHRITTHFMNTYKYNH